MTDMGNSFHVTARLPQFISHNCCRAVAVQFLSNPEPRCHWSGLEIYVNLQSPKTPKCISDKVPYRFITRETAITVAGQSMLLQTLSYCTWVYLGFCKHAHLLDATIKSFEVHLTTYLSSQALVVGDRCNPV
ncbi:hypothetical protein TNCV_508581 [Trichonephila clavipes]|nr:hypothetical protein TNCV_508581 [Trichonephila clavipes]